MSRVVCSSFETNSKTSGIEIDNSSIPGAISLVTSPVHAGTYAAQVSVAAQNSFFLYTPFAANQNTSVFVKVWINITSTPSNTTKLIVVHNSSTSQRAALQVTSGNQLQIVNSTNTQIGSNSATLSTNTWYCVELSVDASVSNGTVTARLNEVVFATGAGSSTAGWSKVYFGMQSNAVTGTVVFDDIAVNDSVGTAQTSFPGRSIYARATPNAAGDSNGFATNVGGTAGAANNFTRVSEVTPDGSTTYNASNTATSSDFFAVSVATVPADHAINCVVLGGQYANTGSADATTAFKWQLKKASGGTVAQSGAIIPNSTTMAVNTPSASGSASGFQLVLYTDPDGNAWTPSTIASMQIGYILTAAGVNPIAVSNVFALVDYNNYSSFFQAFTAAVGMSGVEPKQTNVPLTAGMALAGVFRKANTRGFSSALSFSGTMPRILRRIMNSNLNFTGGMAKFVTIPFSGALGFTGLVQPNGIVPVFLNAALNFTGTVSKAPRKTFAAVVNFTGSFGRSIAKALRAILGFSKDQGPVDTSEIGSSAFGESDFGQSSSGNTDIGQLIVQYIKSKGLYFTGSLGRVIGKHLVSSLGFVSSTNKSSTRYFIGSVSFVTAFLNPLVRFYQAAVAFAGTLSTSLRRAHRPAPRMALSRVIKAMPRISLRRRKP